MDASKSFNSPGGDEEEARLLVTDQSLNTPESNSAASSIKSSPEPERAAPNIFDNDAHRLVQQPQMSDDQSSNDDSSSEGRRSPNLSGYNPDSDGSSPDDGDDISYYYEGEHRPRAQGQQHFYAVLTEAFLHTFNRSSFGNQVLRFSKPKPMKIATGKTFSNEKSIFVSYYIHPKGHDDDYTEFATLNMTLNFKHKKWKHLLNLCTCTATVSVKAYEGHPEDEPIISLDGMLEPTVKVLNDDEKNSLRAHIWVKRVMDLTKLWRSTTCRKDINIEITTQLEIKQDNPDVRVELVTEDNVDSELVVISHQVPR